MSAYPVASRVGAGDRFAAGLQPEGTGPATRSQARRAWLPPGHHCHRWRCDLSGNRCAAPGGGPQAQGCRCARGGLRQLRLRARNRRARPGARPTGVALRALRWLPEHRRHARDRCLVWIPARLEARGRLRGLPL